MEIIRSRRNHPYKAERVTPLGEIPPEFQILAPLPGGKNQILDRRLCYNCDGMKYVECGSVWSHAAQEGFVSPEDNIV